MCLPTVRVWDEIGRFVGEIHPRSREGGGIGGGDVPGGFVFGRMGMGEMTVGPLFGDGKRRRAE